MQRKYYRLSMFCGLLLSFALLGSPARAQRGARMAAPASSAMRRGPSNSAPSSASRRTRNFESFSGFPSVGNFGFAGTGSAGESLGTQAAINPATQIRLAFAERFLRNNRGFLGTGGYYLLDGGGAYIVPADAPASDSVPQDAQQQPQVVVLQQAPAAQPAASQAAAPLPDEGEFTLVLAGGKQIQAAAFVQMKDKIVYISPDGTRHTISLADLDSEATLRVNEERGTPLQLHL